MVDVGDKPISEREATASCYVQMLPETLSMIEQGFVLKRRCSRGSKGSWNTRREEVL